LYIYLIKGESKALNELLFLRREVPELQQVATRLNIYLQFPGNIVVPQLRVLIFWRGC
jgi:hypothetical protein